MLSRLVFFTFTLFWVVMNVLLWRSEFRGKNELGNSVPVSVVWQKMLIAPDDSNLDILQHGKSIGSCRWSPNVGEELATGKTASPDLAPEGSIKQLSGYSIDVMEGSLMLPGYKRIVFAFNSHFSTNHEWQDFAVHVNQRPSTWNLRADAAAETLAVEVRAEGFDWDRTLKFAELRNPEKLFEEFAGPLPLGMLAGSLTSGLGGPQNQNVSLGIKWEARYDWLKIGHSHLRVYRLQTRLLNRYDVVIFVSRVGEILRADLPNDIKLINSRLNL